MIQRNPDRKRFAPEFLNSLHDQARVLHVPGAFVAVVAWLGFALDTDRKLHPEFPELLYIRLGLTAIGVVMLGAAAIEKLSGLRARGKGLGWMTLLYSYVLLSCALFTGRIADDPNYVSGFQIVIMITCFIPFPLRVAYTLIILSILFFTGSIFYFKPVLNSDAASYSMQNVGIACLLSFIVCAVLDHYRFHMFNNTRKITEQGREVREKMEEVVKLKEKQDGDYFLTSLLIKPLIANTAPGNPVSADFLMDQHKKFVFRRWQSEIGGDYLCAHAITLGGVECTAFINGDAMGKSIQGAGGALVLGTVFQSVIERTRAREFTPPPEIWLKECFLDLHKVFSSFDGSMLASAVLSVIENDTGTLYHLNAEHPRTVLLRGGRASFVGSEHVLTKLGVTAASQGLKIQVSQLEPGDILILGSDGRDDLEMRSLDGGGRVINEDEEHFLRIVEQSNGNLEKIRELLAQAGTIIDDLSLMRIGYREDEALEAASSRRALVESARQKAKTADPADVAAAAHAWREYTSLYPCDSEALHACAYAMKLYFGQVKSRDLLEAAVALAERLRLRDPDHARNLLNLADLLRLAGNKDRARKILSEASAAAPDLTGIEKLRQHLA